MGVDDVNLLALEVTNHLDNRHRIDLESHAEGSRFPPNFLEFVVEWFAFECDELDIVAGISLSLGEGHHAVDGPVNHPPRASDMGNP